MGSMRLASIMGTACASAVTAALMLIVPANAASVDWVQTYNNQGHTGENIKEALLSTANVSTLQMKWARSFDRDVRAFVLNDHRVIARIPSDTSPNLDLWYFDYTTGETVWKIDTGPALAPANGTLATGDRLIYSECGLVDKYSHNYSGICAYHKSNGRLVWKFSNPCDCTPEANVAAPLVYANGVVFFGYFMGGSQGQEYAIAANALTGAVIGAYQTGGVGSLDNAPFVQGGRHLYLGCGGSVCALSRGDGSLLWKSNLSAPIGGLSADKSGNVYVNLCNGTAGLVALDGATGNQRWSYGSKECNRTPAAISGSRVYFTAADKNVHALDAATGTEVWSGAPGTASSPSLANGVMYVAGGAGAPAASAYDLGTGSLLWSAPVHTNHYALPPVIIEGTLYVTNQACGGLCAYGLPSHGVRR